MNDVPRHYSAAGGLAEQIEHSLRASGRDLSRLTTHDLAPIDEFHVRGRPATLELASRMCLSERSEVLDIGSGLGGPARTLAETFDCRVTGVDLTDEFCRTARVLSTWVGLADRTQFDLGDALDLPYSDDRFDAAMTIHVAMNIADKAGMYTEANRVVKTGGRFAVYDICQGEGGAVNYPVPWARDSSISHLANPTDMEALLVEAGFTLLEVNDSTEASQSWFEALAERMKAHGPPPLTFQAFLGQDFQTMAVNQVRNLAERRIRTVIFICEA